MVELEDDSGPGLGILSVKPRRLTLDVPHFGSYRGKIYAWALAAPIRSVTPVDLMIDESVVYGQVLTPR
ncbi:MAG TPA: hypothetical protein VHN14_07475 [Kofleriaceae bacterium]|nr:hypothetical protein [Kofleriaceae bacterium]